MDDIFVVDRIVNDIVVCENRSTKKMKILFLNELPEGIKEGTVLRYKDGEYTEDKEEQEIIESRIEEKMRDIWNDFDDEE